MRILLLTFYFGPDLCAGSFRATPLAKELASRLGSEGELDVITTLPNRYKSFSSEAPERESDGVLSITRIRLPAHESGMLDQSKAFNRFVREALRATKDKSYDVVVATSSRLMTAALGAYIARRCNGKLYLDIRDIFVDTIKDVLPRRVAWLAKFAFSFVERYAIKRADTVNLVSAGFLPYFKSRYPDQRYTTITNGIDDAFLKMQPETPYPAGERPHTVVYAGNMGEGQGLHQIVPQLAAGFEGELRFILIGDGGRKGQLLEALATRNCSNVEVRDPVSRPELINIYMEADVLFLHLNDYDAFLKVLPSKIFEYAALGKPIWAGVAGYAADFLKKNVDNVAVFPPCDHLHGREVFQELDLHTRRRSEFVVNYSRSQLTRKLANGILELAEPPI